MSPAKSKRLGKLLRLFEWRVTHRNTDDGSLDFCGSSITKHSCLRRSLRELNNLTGRKITCEQVFAVADALIYADDRYSDADLDDCTRSAVQWVIGQYEQVRHGR